MLGLRTPQKKGEAEKSPIPVSNVRRSISHWETTKPRASSTSPTMSATAQAGPAETAPKSTHPQKTLTIHGGKVNISRRTSADNPPPAKLYKSRTVEAMACVARANNFLTESRNLKREIKAGVENAVMRLSQLVREAEKELAAGKGKEERSQTGGTAIGEGASNLTFVVNKDENPLLAKIEEHSRLLLDSNMKIEELKNMIEQQKDRLGRVETPLSSEVAAAQSSKSLGKRNTLHSVVVTSKNEEETGEEVLEKVRKAVDAKEGWITVERVRKAKNRKVIMGFGTREDRDKVKSRLEGKGVDLTVEEVRNKDPLVILRDVLSVNTDEDVLKALRNQNGGVFRGLGEEENRINVKYRRKARNPHSCHIIICVSPTIWQRITANGHVYIDLQRVRAEDQTPLMQCTRCLGYGHSRKFCEEAADACSHCGGSHLKTDCLEWIAGATASCTNCKKANLVRVDHNAFDAECPIRRKWDQIARSTVAYC